MIPGLGVKGWKHRDITKPAGSRFHPSLPSQTLPLFRLINLGSLLSVQYHSQPPARSHALLPVSLAPSVPQVPRILENIVFLPRIHTCLARESVVSAKEGLGHSCKPIDSQVRAGGVTRTRRSRLPSWSGVGSGSGKSEWVDSE